MLLLTENYDFQGESSPPPEFKKSRPGQIPVCVPDEASSTYSFLAIFVKIFLGKYLVSVISHIVKLFLFISSEIYIF